MEKQMKKPDAKLEKELNSKGLFTEEPVPFENAEGPHIALTVEIAFETETVIEDLLFAYDIVFQSKRGVRTRFTGFREEVRDGYKVLTFKAYQKIPVGLKMSIPSDNLAMSFIDLCWYAGNEEIDTNMIPTVATPKRPEFITCDMGWYLPSRFVDSFILALGDLNEYFLQGLLEEAMLYGPTLKD